jgi:hypothetical protein
MLVPPGVRPKLEVPDIFRWHGAAIAPIRPLSRPPDDAALWGRSRFCRTAALGGHVERCDDCGEPRIACDPTTPAVTTARSARVSPASSGWPIAKVSLCRFRIFIFHLVFIVSARFASVALQNKAGYDILFRAADRDGPDHRRRSKASRGHGFVSLSPAWLRCWPSGEARYFFYRHLTREVQQIVTRSAHGQAADQPGSVSSSDSTFEVFNT